jgi:hypothetical protein
VVTHWHTLRLVEQGFVTPKQLRSLQNRLDWYQLRLDGYAAELKTEIQNARVGTHVTRGTADKPTQGTHRRPRTQKVS